MQHRYLIVETPIATGCNPYVTHRITVDEEMLVRDIQAEAIKGYLFVSNTFGLATYEPSKVLSLAREKARSGWRFRAALRGRAQVQDFVLSYAMYPDGASQSSTLAACLAYCSWSSLNFSAGNDTSQQLELVELRGTGSVISGALIRIVKVLPAWAKRGWRLSCVMYNLVTTYDKANLFRVDMHAFTAVQVTIDPPESALMQHDAFTDFLFSVEEVGGRGELSLYYNVGAFFERRMVPSEEGKLQVREEGRVEFWRALRLRRSVRRSNREGTRVQTGNMYITAFQGKAGESVRCRRERREVEVQEECRERRCRREAIGLASRNEMKASTLTVASPRAGLCLPCGVGGPMVQRVEDPCEPQAMRQIPGVVEYHNDQDANPGGGKRRDEEEAAMLDDMTTSLDC
eukprot:764352-Hanusia_phi.AAC.6